MLSEEGTTNLNVRRLIVGRDVNGGENEFFAGVDATKSNHAGDLAVARAEVIGAAQAEVLHLRRGENADLIVGKAASDLKGKNLKSN